MMTCSQKLRERIDALNAAMALDPELLPPVGAVVRIIMAVGDFEGEVVAMRRMHGHDDADWSWKAGVCVRLLCADGSLDDVWYGPRHNRIEIVELGFERLPPVPRPDELRRVSDLPENSENSAGYYVNSRSGRIRLWKWYDAPDAGKESP